MGGVGGEDAVSSDPVHLLTGNIWWCIVELPYSRSFRWSEMRHFALSIWYTHWELAYACMLSKNIDRT